MGRKTTVWRMGEWENGRMGERGSGRNGRERIF
jgi:hypothetical protein